jgi:hypothetical protein
MGNPNLYLEHNSVDGNFFAKIIWTTNPIQHIIPTVKPNSRQQNKQKNLHLRVCLNLSYKTLSEGFCHLFLLKTPQLLSLCFMNDFSTSCKKNLKQMRWRKHARMRQNVYWSLK